MYLDVKIFFQPFSEFSILLYVNIIKQNFRTYLFLCNFFIKHENEFIQSINEDYLKCINHSYNEYIIEKERNIQLFLWIYLLNNKCLQIPGILAVIYFLTVKNLLPNLGYKNLKKIVCLIFQQIHTMNGKKALSLRKTISLERR